MLEGYDRDFIWPTTLSPVPSSLFINREKDMYVTILLQSSILIGH